MFGYQGGGSRKRKTKTKSRARSKKTERKSRKTKKTGKKRKMNQFFTMMLAARKKNSPSFVYKNKTYHRKERGGVTFYRA